MARRTSSTLPTKLAIFSIALILALLLLVQPPPEGMTESGRNALIIFILCLALWVTNLIPLAATVPIVAQMSSFSFSAACVPKESSTARNQ